MGKSDVRVKEPAEGSFGRANGFRAGEGPVGGRAEGMRVVMFWTLPARVVCDFVLGRWPAMLLVYVKLLV